MRRALLTILGVLFAAQVACAQDVAPVTTSQVCPLVGTYEVTGGLRGRLTVAGSDARLTVTFAQGDVKRSGRAKGKERSWKVWIDPDASGMANRLQGAAVEQDAEVLALRAKGDGFVGRTRKGQAVRLQRRRAVLIVLGGAEDPNDSAAFRVYGKQVADYYRQKGYARVEQVLMYEWQKTIDALNQAPAAGHPYSRVVFVGHGGWDGPISYGGVSDSQGSPDYNPELWETIVRAFGAGTTRSAKVWVSCCHAGGSDRYERQDPKRSKLIWVDALAGRTARTVAGPCGSTSTEWSLQLVKALEGEGALVQETRYATVRGGRYLSRGSRRRR